MHRQRRLKYFCCHLGHLFDIIIRPISTTDRDKEARQKHTTHIKRISWTDNRQTIRSKLFFVQRPIFSPAASGLVWLQNVSGLHQPQTHSLWQQSLTDKHSQHSVCAYLYTYIQYIHDGLNWGWIMLIRWLTCFPLNRDTNIVSIYAWFMKIQCMKWCGNNQSNWRTCMPFKSGKVTNELWY